MEFKWKIKDSSVDFQNIIIIYNRLQNYIAKYLIKLKIKYFNII